MSVPFRFGLFRRLVLPCALAMACAGPSLAQDRPALPDEERYGRPGDDFTLRFCVDPRDPGWELDQAVGEAIAQALLLEPQVHVVEDTNERAEFEDIYRHLLADCSVYFGFKLIAEGYPDWVTVTRPYYETGYVFVAKPPAPARLGDIPRSEALGATLGSAADFRLVQFNNSQPAAQRWRRFPMGTDQLALEAVLKGTVAASLVWAPSFFELGKTRPEFAELEVVAPDPLTIPPMPVGAIMLSREIFLRTNIDQAIATLVADGVIAEILAAHDMPGSAPP
jgi:polar amino acid transport system substrate-binding protein